VSYTPGPWDIGDLDRNDQRQITAHSSLIATCAHECLSLREQIMEANAQLIAAAPELLDALKEVAHHADDECGFMVLVKAAIAKAEGR